MKFFSGICAVWRVGLPLTLIQSHYRVGTRYVSPLSAWSDQYTCTVAQLHLHMLKSCALCMTCLWGAGGAASRWPWTHGSWISSSYKYSGKRLRYTPQP